jgi:hypothetical protein
MRGADFVKECSSTLLTKGYIYFTNINSKKYALLRNAEMNDDKIHLSLDFGQNNKCGGNFSIRTEQQTNFIIKNNMVGINQPNPVATLDISGTVIASNTFIANGPIIANNTITLSYLNQGGPIYATTNGLLQTNRPFHIIDPSASIPFTINTMFVLEIPREITLPVAMYDGYTMMIINKCGESIDIISTDNMFSAFYLPNGGKQFSLDPNRKIELTYCLTTTTNSSWVFNTF